MHPTRKSIKKYPENRSTDKRNKLNSGETLVIMVSFGDIGSGFAMTEDLVPPTGLEPVFWP